MLMGKVVVESPLVNSLFKCTLCHGLIRSPTVINECLDRFCKLCITNHFEKNHNDKCPTCHMTLSNPLDTLKPDLTFQRLLYKIFPSIFQREIACRPPLLSPTITNESTRIYIDSTIDIHLEYWDISTDLFPNSNPSSLKLPSCYLKCQASTPLASLEKFIRNRYFLSADLQIDLFYKTFLLNIEQERLIDICYCFDRMNKNETLDVRFLVSPCGYKAICNHMRQLKSPRIEIPDSTLPNPAEKENLVTHSPASTTSSSTNSQDPKIKVKIRRSQTATNNWYIPQSQLANTTEPVELPDLVNSCATTTTTPSATPSKTPKRKQPTTSNEPSRNKKSTFFSAGHVSQATRPTPIKPPTKPRRRTRFIPTMVQTPLSFVDRISMNQYDYSDQESDDSPLCPSSELLEQSVTTLRPSEMVIVNVEGNVNESNDTKRTQKTICKVPPYIPESSDLVHSPPEKSSSIVKPTSIFSSLSPMRRTLLPKKIPTIIPSLPIRSASPDTTNSAPLDLSLK